MGDRAVIERIGAWEAAGLIDTGLAARLRAAEEAQPERESDSPTAAARGGSRFAPAAGFFGPAVTVAEMFSYLGGAFVLGAWYATLGRIAEAGTQRDLVWLLGSAATAGLLAVIGIVLAGGSARRQRAAGVMFVVAIANAAAAASFAGQLILQGDTDARLVLAGLVAVAVAMGFRRIHPAVLTQLGLLGAIAGLTWGLLTWFGQVLFPQSFDLGPTAPLGPDPIIEVFLILAAWLLTAAAFGLIGLREARRESPAASQRAAVSRSAAGLTAVLGAAMAISISAVRLNGEYGRVLEPAMGDVILLVIAAILLERAFRREASSYVYAAGLGVIIALTDLNSSYLARATSMEVGLLVEGAILLVAGFLFDRLRRRVTGGGTIAGPAVPNAGPPNPNPRPTGVST